MAPCFPALSRSVFALLALAVYAVAGDRPRPYDDPHGEASVPTGISTQEWNGIRAARAAAHHVIRAIEDGHSARNPGQQWTTTFDGRGSTTSPDDGGWTWGLELERYGFAGAERATNESITVTTDATRVEYEWNEELTEWYVNDARGLEHGFTVHRRPAPGADELEPLTFTLAVRGGLRAEVATGGRDVRFIDDGGTSVLTYVGLTVLDADGRRLSAGFETTGDRLLLSIDERGACYPLTIDPIAQQAYLKASNTEASDGFGEAVAVSGDTVVVGARLEDGGATGVNGDQASNVSSNSGAAYVYVRSGASWIQQAYLKPSNSVGTKNFGRSVAVSGDTIVVGAPLESSDSTGVNGDETPSGAGSSGAAYVFVRNGTTWSQQAYLKASNTGVSDNFGYSVAVSGDLVVGGAILESSNATGVDGDGSNDLASGSGAAYVFARSGTTWSQQAYLKASNTGAQDWFGHSVSVSGDTVVVGTFLEDSNSTGVNGDANNDGGLDTGAAYVFVRDGATWSQQAYLKASNTGNNDRFAYAVAVSGDTIVVGAPTEDSNATGVGGNQASNLSIDSGAAYVFVRIGSSWSQQAYLKASNTGSQDQFGYRVSASGELVAIAAYLEDSNAIGIDGDGTNNLLTNSGAAYVFARIGTTWGHLAYLKASNTGGSDELGWSVSVSDGTVVVGAYREDSDATGVDGDGSNNLANGSGAAYVFFIDGGSSQIVPFCFGDGSLVTACPCGNTGSSGRGCDNSAATGGALLTATGSTSPDTVVFQSAGELPTALSIFLQGNNVNASGIVFGDGVRCVAGSLKRLYAKNAVAGVATAPVGPDPSVTAQSASLGDPIAPGSTRWYQVYYRDPILAFCPSPPGDAFNVSNGLSVVW